MTLPEQLPELDPIDAWIAANPWTPPASMADPEAERAAWLRGDAIGSYCVNRGAFELLHAVEGSRLLRDVERNPALARRWRLRLTKTLDAWTLARREWEAGRRSSPAFAILDLDRPAGGRPRAARRPRRSPEQRARQRHRYKGAMADTLEAFGRTHLVRDPRAGLYRPRWVDHVASCTNGYCGGCARVQLPPAPRWRRRDAGRRRRDWLTIPEWILDRATAARGCQDVIALQDVRCGGVVVVPQSCRVRTCPDCEAARQARVVDRYRAAIEELDPDRARFLTLPKRTPPRGELAAGLVDLADAVEKLRRRAIWRGGRCRDRGRCALSGNWRHRKSCAGESCPSWQPGSCRQPWDPSKPGWRIPHEPVTASMTTTEVTYNMKARTWHPHAHLLIEAPYIDQAELADTWQQLTGDSRVVWIESVHRHAATEWAGDVPAALRELLKYAAKPHRAYLDAEDPAVVAELLVALRGRHLTATGGRLYGRTDLEQDPAERDLVLVWPTHEGAERPYHAPRICPHCVDVGDWRVMDGHRRRADCTPAPDPSRPGRSILTWRPPAGDTLPGNQLELLTDGPTITGTGEGI